MSSLICNNGIIYVANVVAATAMRFMLRARGKAVHNIA